MRIKSVININFKLTPLPFDQNEFITILASEFNKMKNKVHHGHHWKIQPLGRL